MPMTLEELKEAIAKEDKLIFTTHIRACYKGCVPGWRKFATTHGIDIRDAVTTGIKASVLLATDDVMAEKVVRSLYE